MDYETEANNPAETKADRIPTAAATMTSGTTASETVVERIAVQRLTTATHLPPELYWTALMAQAAIPDRRTATYSVSVTTTAVTLPDGSAGTTQSFSFSTSLTSISMAAGSLSFSY